MKKINRFRLIAILSAVNLIYNIHGLKHFQFLNEPIDVVIPAISKDIETLDLCIEGIKKNGKSVRNVYVVSPEPLTAKATWVDEKDFPFSKYDVAFAIYKNQEKAKAYLAKPGNRIGWIYQQLLKLYAPLIIKGVSSNVLLLDSDTIFLNPVSFLNERFEPLFNPGISHGKQYFVHAKKVIPGFKKFFRKHSGITHHMLVQKNVMESLFATIKLHNQNMDPWKALCHHIDREASGDVTNLALSEFEIYFNYIFAATNQAHIRTLRWANVSSLASMERYKAEGYHYISCHTYMKKGRAPRQFWFKPIGKYE